MPIEIITKEDLNEFRTLLLSELKEILQAKPEQTKQWQEVISPELQEFMDTQKIPSLAALLVIDDERLLGMEGFGWRLLKEVLQLRKIQ